MIPLGIYVIHALAASWIFRTSFAFGVKQPLTSAVLQVSYDGSLFHGWSASNNKGNVTDSVDSVFQTRKSGRSRRNKLRPSMKKGDIRSVEQSLQGALSKLYGNVPPKSIVVEGCSRTDKGVHSEGSYALIYCMIDESGSNSIQGKRLPHPTGPDDTAFKELPFKSDLQQMVFAMNKMLPPDVRVTNASPMPVRGGDIEQKIRPFHPSLDSLRKTYRYTFSIGDIHDPIRCRDVWHVPHCAEFDIDRGKECAKVLCGNHDFVAFRGAFRGNERGKQQNTYCTIFDITLSEEEGDGKDSLGLCKTYSINITGDRFLYKQVRFMVGTIVQCAMKVVTKEDVKEILRSKRWIESTSNGQLLPRFCAPAHGLCLRSVDFDKDWRFDWLIEAATAREHRLNA